jgi:hypothetical protein
MEKLKKRPIGKEDIAFDIGGVFAQDEYTLPNGEKQVVTRVNASNIPLLSDTRQKLDGTPNVDEALKKLKKYIDGFSVLNIMKEDKVVEFEATDTPLIIQEKINNQSKNLGGFSLTFVFPAHLNQILNQSLFFDGFMNGTLVITGDVDPGNVVIYDQANINCLIELFHCQCNIEIKNLSFVHQYSKYAIKTTGCSSITTDNCSFVGNVDSFAMLLDVSTGKFNNCSFYEDGQAEFKDQLFYDLNKKINDQGLSAKSKFEQIEEKINSLKTDNDYVAETWVSEDKNNWYRKYQNRMDRI